MLSHMVHHDVFQSVLVCSSLHPSLPKACACLLTHSSSLLPLPPPQDYSKAKAAAATPARPPTVVRAAAKETPQERLKRLMAAQLNKKIQKDSLTAAQVK